MNYTDCTEMAFKEMDDRLAAAIAEIVRLRAELATCVDDRTALSNSVKETATMVIEAARLRNAKWNNEAIDQWLNTQTWFDGKLHYSTVKLMLHRLRDSILSAKAAGQEG